MLQSPVNNLDLYGQIGLVVLIALAAIWRPASGGFGPKFVVARISHCVGGDSRWAACVMGGSEGRLSGDVYGGGGSNGVAPSMRSLIGAQRDSRIGGVPKAFGRRDDTTSIAVRIALPRSDSHSKLSFWFNDCPVNVDADDSRGSGYCTKNYWHSLTLTGLFRRSGTALYGWHKLVREASRANRGVGDAMWGASRCHAGSV
jgi:hypothetical protein